MMYNQLPFTMEDVLGLLQISYRKLSNNQANIECIACGKKKLNIDFRKQVFRCAKCGNDVSGNALKLYTLYTGVEKPYKEICEKLSIGDVSTVKKRTYVEPPIEVIRDIRERNEIYSLMINNLKLLDSHKVDLLRRGLSEEQIIKNGYFSLPTGYGRQVSSLILNSGYNLCHMPGFYTDSNSNWKFVDWYEGYMIPVRNYNNKVQGFQLRSCGKVVDKEKKYIWISSSGKPNGTKQKSYVHFACDFENDIPKLGSKVFLTEGPLKADVAHFISGLPFIAVAGVNATSELDEVLSLLKSSGVTSICTAFDMDYLTNPYVVKAKYSLNNKIKKYGLNIEELRWDESYKGVDDYLLHLNS